MDRLDRRRWLVSLVASFGGVLAFGSSDAAGGQRPRVRRARRRVRRRVRRRIRRRVLARRIGGRLVWVVPVGLAIGWELMYENRIVVVKETKIIDRDGAKIQVAVVQDGGGKVEEVEILREDTDDNRKELEGGVLPDGDKATPGVDAEIEVEVED